MVIKQIWVIVSPLPPSRPSHSGNRVALELSADDYYITAKAPHKWYSGLFSFTAVATF